MVLMKEQEGFQVGACCRIANVEVICLVTGSRRTKWRQ